MPDSRNYYDILEVSRGATAQAIKQAYRRLARQYHPDLHPENPTAAERFKEICQAYQVLSNPIQRRQYDQQQQVSSPPSPSRTTQRTAQTFYRQAVAKAQAKDYQGAIADCHQALALNPHWVEAYIERAAAYYKLGQAREALQDCRQALTINPNCAKAYYYQGRARYRLGYTQAAIEAYTSALSHAPQDGKTYYHRGLAYKDLAEYDQAIVDLQQAAEWFRQQGDKTGEQLAQEMLRVLKQTQEQPQPSTTRPPRLNLKRVFGDAMNVLQSFILNPGEGLLSSFANLDQQRAIAVGLVFAGLFDLCFALGIYWGWQDIFRPTLLKLIGVGIVPFVMLVAMSAIARSLWSRYGSWSSDIFISGATLIPLSVLIVLSAISTHLGPWIMSIVSVFASCYTILTLYSGHSQITQISDAMAAFFVPIMLLVSGGFCYLAFIAM